MPKKVLEKWQTWVTLVIGLLTIVSLIFDLPGKIKKALAPDNKKVIIDVQLGNALSDQGICTGGEEGRRLLAAAIAAFKQALEVRTYEHLPLDWAQTQNNLAKTYFYLEDWLNVAECYANVLKVYPL